ncbi:nucleotide binding [Ascochyta rabiei]|uniref:Nucleotide binding n=1 Tax=Didymella rabiei TaxID=5454 RepID=A0A163F451_DIDRA|nr:nucleotide binding [Ascochyta rabiei]
MSYHRMTLHKFHAAQLVFVKNVPQESASSVASLYTQYNPLEIKNLYPAARITTLMIALPTADVAVSALHRTDGMRVDSTVINVERYNAKKSIVARRETRRKRNGGSADTRDDEYEDDEWEEEDEPLESWEDEDETYVDDGPVVEHKTSQVDGVSWADVTRGRNLTPETPSSPSFAMPVVTTPQTPVMTSHSSSLMEGDLARYAIPIITIAPATSTLTSMGQLQQLSSPSTHSIEEPHAAPQDSMPSKNSGDERVDGDSGQATLVPNVPQQQHRSFSWPSDTTVYIRERHCASCAFCKKRNQG